MIMTEAASLTLNDNSTHRTGYWLTEFTHPYEEFLENGFEIRIATPTGKRPTMDPIAEAKNPDGKLLFWANEQDYESAIQIKNNVIDKSQILDLRNMTAESLNKFSGVFFVGGHGVMEDLLTSPDVKKLLQLSDAAGIPVALVCHAPIVLAKIANLFPQGSSVTAFTDQEEAQAHIKKALLKTTPEMELTAAGFKFIDGGLWADHVVKLSSKRNTLFIAGQNPTSAKTTAVQLCGAILQKLP
ncbi:MAG: type 1 glutamine amidotransferase domain-containing protein [Deltaproteobacteria bacterium]|nr:type 1 glutamine amidotransferase domain-containing protein [Deltaproteobacteria bacterium]